MRVMIERDCAGPDSEYVYNSHYVGTWESGEDKEQDNIKAVDFLIDIAKSNYWNWT